MLLEDGLGHTSAACSVGRAVEAVPGDNGFEAWRQIELLCEPSVGVKEAQVLMAYTNMSASRAKTTKYLKKLMSEMQA